MIEDREGVDKIDEILSVEGMDMVYIGKMDMAFSYGVSFTPLAGRDDPVIEEAIAKICNACKELGIPVRFTVGRETGEIVPNAKRWAVEGRSKLFMVNDQALLTQGARRYVIALGEGLIRE
jgi:4-hydroxy-2-oxoheptanedioate aldolase